MARQYPKQYADARERVNRHSDRYQDPSDADRILQMADAYDEDNLVVDTPDAQDTKSVTTLKNYLTGLKRPLLTSRSPTRRRPN